MKKFLYILQLFLKFSLIFFISFIWLRYALKSFWIAFGISFLISAFFMLVIFFIKRKNVSKTNLKLNEQEDAENIFLSLSVSQNPTTFFFDLAKSRHKEVLKKKNYIIIKSSDKTNILLYPYIKYNKITKNDLIQIINKIKNEQIDRLIITCFDYEKDVLRFSTNFDIDIKLLDQFESFAYLYKEYNFFPEIVLKNKKEAKRSFKDLIAFSFNKTRTKGYIFASFVLFITSFFVKLNIYYCIISTLLLMFAFISFFNPKFNKINSKELI